MQQIITIPARNKIGKRITNPITAATPLIRALHPMQFLRQQFVISCGVDSFPLSGICFVSLQSTIFFKTDFSLNFQMKWNYKFRSEMKTKKIPILLWNEIENIFMRKCFRIYVFCWTLFVSGNIWNLFTIWIRLPMQMELRKF